jgi:CheY-like chemotaxis protein
VQCYLAASGDHAEAPRSLALAGIHVLVVEDHPDTLDVMRTMLENFGAVVTGAGTVRQGHDALRQVRPDILVSDISMPHDGFELIRDLIAFAAETGVRVPAVAITSNGTGRDLIRGAGFAAFVSKPFDPLALAALIRRLASPAAPVNP